MSIVIALKVGDGVVLGADSASALVTMNGYAENVYFSGEKLLNLVPGLPVGMLTHGLGGLDNRSTTRLARDLAKELGSTDSTVPLNPATYTIEQVTARVRDFFRPRYLRRFMATGDAERMGFVLAGYSAGASTAEVWSVRLAGAAVEGPSMELGREHSDGLFWQGEGTAIARLIHGLEPTVKGRLAELGVPPENLARAIEARTPLWHATMPVQEAIDVVRYLADVVVGYVRFTPGALTVAPPIDLAAITPHDGFRWVARKQWFDPRLNSSSPAQEATR
ncbi:hypothetical protein SAMN05216486_1209 [bacterium JGI 053]|nr:hypothetical protein SAMN05216486_1209 [bacterium JGI 053]